jgi:taurine--2-oxoglutarate transaminase
VAEVVAYETPEAIAAFILEPIVGAGGVIIPPDGYLKRVKEICEANDILMIADEVMTGFGRSGRWFGMEHWDVVPDLMTMAKGLTSAYAPLGGVAISNRLAEALEKEMLYCGLTYSCHPLSCATADAVIGVYQDENLVENSRSLGEILKTQLEKMQQRHPCIGDVRALGLFACLELVKNRETKEPLIPYNARGEAATLSKKISTLLASKGVCAPLRWMFLSISPPLCITEEELKNGLVVIDEVLGEVDKMVK